MRVLFAMKTASKYCSPHIGGDHGAAAHRIGIDNDEHEDNDAAGV